MADLQKKSAQLFDISTPSTSARTTITPLPNGGAQYDIANATWAAAKYANISVSQGTKYTLTIYIDEYSGTGTFMIPLRQIDDSGTVISIDTITSTGAITHTFTAEGSIVFLGVYLNNSPTVATATAKLRIMLNEGETALPFEPYSSTGWVHSLRKMSSATETIQSGDTIYANGQPISTYTVKGNTVQNGTPTPSNPVMPQGTGDRTENLWNEDYTGISDTIIYKPVFVGDGQFTMSNNAPRTSDLAALLFFLAGNVSSGASSGVNGVWDEQSRTVTSINGYVTVAYRTVRTYTPVGSQTMLNSGSTAKPYEPYGYKIPILTPQGSAVNYLGSVTSTRNIKKLVLTGTEADITYTSGNAPFKIGLAEPMKFIDNNFVWWKCTHYQAVSNAASWSSYDYLVSYSATEKVDDTMPYLRIRDIRYTSADDFKSFLATEYANGTPVTIYYVLATETTGTVNEQLQSIYNYYDSIANAVSIPTTDGANTITVDTTVQPSEFTATWTGWHDSSVKEYDGSDWQ